MLRPQQPEQSQQQIPLFLTDITQVGNSNINIIFEQLNCHCYRDGFEIATQLMVY